MRHTPWRAVLCLIGLFGVLAACGGGGGGGGVTPNGGGLPPPAGGVEGRISFIRGSSPLIVEQEPNNDFGSAQFLGEFAPGQTVTSLGTLDAAGDTFDGYRLRLPVRSRVTVTLRFSAASDYDLGVYDTTGMQFVDLFDIPTPPGTQIFHLQGTVDFVVTANSGSGSYELQFEVDVLPSAVLEVEPNDTPAEAEYLGQISAGEMAEVEGSGDPSTDPVDAYLIAAPAAVELAITLQFPSFRNYDVRVSDVTTDISSPVLIQDFVDPGGPPEGGALSIPAGTLLLIEVRAISGGGAWRLNLTGTAPPSPKPGTALKATAGAQGIASLALEDACLKHGQEDCHYGVVADELAPGQALVCFRDGEAAGGAAHLAHCGAHVAMEAPSSGCLVELALPDGLSPEDARRLTVSRVCAAAASNCVRFSEPNRYRRMSAEPDDTHYGLQWHYDMINLPAAWDISTGDASIIVAVIDTGRVLAPDLSTRLIDGYDVVLDLSFAGDGDGHDPDPTDLGVQTSYHGTHVAGTIGAETNNSFGVAGVTWATRIMPIRALGNYGFGTDFDVATGILYAAGQPNATGTIPPEACHIINMSLGGAGSSQTMADAIATARAVGVTVIAAAGNANSAELQYPASYPGVISVSAVDAVRNRAPYSSFGTEVDIAAPGGNTNVDTHGDGYPDGVLSTVNGSSYAFYNGTSMACPHVAGVAALILAVNPALTPDQVEAVLTSTAQDLGATGRDDSFGHGLVDAFAALSSIAPPSGPAAPALFVNPSSLSFGTSVDQRDLTVANIGGGLLTVSSIEVEVDAGQNWLTAEAIGTGDATRSIDGVRVTVNRAGLPSGSYFGRVIIRSDGGDRTIPLAMLNSFLLPPPPNLDIHIFAIRTDTGELAGEVVVNPAISLDYVFQGLVAGEYVFTAATDVDGDGVYEEFGEYQGAFPVLSDPIHLNVIANVTWFGVDFDVTLQRSLGAAAPR